MSSIGAADQAAAEAAAYWRGGRVRALEEPNLPAPLIEINNSIRVEINYQGESLVQECLEYYMDKHTAERRVRERLLSRERKALQSAQPGANSEAKGPNRATRRATGLITYLLMENAERTIHLDLLLSLHCLGRFFGNHSVTIFYTNGSTATELALLRSSAPKGLRLGFEQVHLDFPPAVAGSPGGPDAFLAPPHCTMDGQHRWSTHRSCGCRCPAWRPQCWPLNWMHATRFFTAGMFRTHAFRQGGFDFFMRLDTDLFFVEAPEIDPFRLMADRGCAMVYDTVSREAPGCHDGFDELTLRYFGHFGYRGAPDGDLLHVGHGPGAAGGQWTLGDAKLFSSEKYLDFADFAAGGIYRNRWADQLLMLRGLALFGPKAPAMAICIRSLFAQGTEAGFVHRKGGFRDPMLLQRCGVPS